MKYWWERLKVKPSEKSNVHDFMEENDFLWEVLSLPCYTYVNGNYVEIKKNRVVARSDDMKPMYVVRKQYHLLSNEECFDIANKFKEKYKDSKFISCGDILNQKKSYLTMLLKTIDVIGATDVYLTITNGFDGRNAVNCTLTLVRRKDNSVIQMFDKSYKRIWTMGRLDISKKFETVVQEIEDTIDYTIDICTKLNNVEIVLNDVINPLFDLDWLKKKCVNKHIAEEKEQIRDNYILAKGKTLFDLYVAMSNYFCNFKMKRNGKLGDDKRFNFAMIGYFYPLYNYLTYLMNYIK